MTAEAITSSCLESVMLANPYQTTAIPPEVAGPNKASHFTIVRASNFLAGKVAQVTTEKAPRFVSLSQSPIADAVPAFIDDFG